MIRDALGDQSRLWRVVRCVLRNELGSGRTRLPSQLLLDGGVSIQDPDLIASEMNQYFVVVAGDLRARLLEDNSNRPRSFTLSREVDRSVYARPTDDGEISQILHTINPKSAMGVDHVSARFLRGLGDTFVQAMSRATNKSLKCGFFVNSFKIARFHLCSKQAHISCVTITVPLRSFPISQRSLRMLYTVDFMIFLAKMI